VVLFAVCAGLDAVFTRWPEIQTALRWTGAAYLLYLAWRILRSGEAQAAQSRKPLTALEAAGFQFVNPKAWMMTVTAAAMFLPRELGVLTASSYMVGIMAVTNLPCIAVWAIFGSSMRGFLAKPKGRMIFNIVLALALAVTGIAMVL
jgi:threonine/homoserine/homoserine lactone efflux protein